MAPPLVSVVAVAVVILLLLVLNSRPSEPGPAPGAVSVPPSTAPSSAPVSSSPRTSAAASATSATPVSSPPVNEPPATQQPVVARPPVTVLNNSRRSGLAHHVAAEVQAKGWPLGRVGNFTGRIAMTTIYYAAGQRPAAAELARVLPQIRRIEPRFAGLPGSGLTLVVTRDWSG